MSTRIMLMPSLGDCPPQQYRLRAQHTHIQKPSTHRCTRGWLFIFFIIPSHCTTHIDGSVMLCGRKTVCSTTLKRGTLSEQLTSKCYTEFLPRKRSPAKICQRQWQLFRWSRNESTSMLEVTQLLSLYARWGIWCRSLIRDPVRCNWVLWLAPLHSIYIIAPGY